jgi:hypothetical protein
MTSRSTAATSDARNQRPENQCADEHPTGTPVAALAQPSVPNDASLDLRIWSWRTGERTLNGHNNVLR